MIYRYIFIDDEIIDPNGHQAKYEFYEWSLEFAELTDLGYKDEKVKSAQKRKKLIKEMDKVIKEDLK